MNSTLVGSSPAFTRFGTRVTALSRSSYTAATSTLYGGSGNSFRVALHMMPNVPSEPMISCSRQYPVLHFFRREPRVVISPVGVTTSTEYTWCRVVP